LPKIENHKHFLSNAPGRLLVCDIKATTGSNNHKNITKEKCWT